MLKVVTFMKQVATGLQVEGNFGTAHVYRSSLNAIIAYCGEEDLLFSDCLLYTSPSPRDSTSSRMPSSA